MQLIGGPNKYSGIVQLTISGQTPTAICNLGFTGASPAPKAQDMVILQNVSMKLYFLCKY